MDTMPDNMKQDLCERTKAACKSSCSNNVNELTCDTQNLHWTCKCSDQNINLATYNFPIPLNMCLLDHQNCAANCQHLGKQHNADQVCRLQCDSSYACGTDKAPTDSNNGAAAKFDASAEAKRAGVSVSGAETVSSSKSLYALHAAIAGAVLLFGSGFPIQ